MWTSAINGFFDAHSGTRPLNTHTVSRLKRRYHDKQLARTMALLPEGALGPREARYAVPGSGLEMLLQDAVRAADVSLRLRLVLMLVSVVFYSRPATVWGFEPWDVCVYVAGGSSVYLACVSRHVKMHPEYLTTPNRREVRVPTGDVTHPLAQLAWCVWRLQVATNGTWCTGLRRVAGKQSAASGVITGWLRSSLPQTRLPLPAGRLLSSYSLRIAGVSIAAAHHVDSEWIVRWALWTSKAMAERYTQRDYGRSEFAAMLLYFAFGSHRAACSHGEHADALNSLGAARGGRVAAVPFSPERVRLLRTAAGRRQSAGVLIAAPRG
jgi:hypothetical protein